MKHYTTRQIAKVLDTDPRRLRYFLRKQKGDHPGKGSRYSFTKPEAQAIIRKFRRWSEHRAA